MAKNPRVWVIADTHFGHALMAQTRGFDGDIDAHDKALFDAWNSTVAPHDTVWHLGDVYFRDGYKWLHRLNGDKRLCLGNHDAQKADVLKHNFKLYGMCEAHGALLSHMPVHEGQLARFRVNVHGHTHANRLADTRYAPVSVEQLPEWKPILLRDAVRSAGGGN